MIIQDEITWRLSSILDIPMGDVKLFIQDLNNNTRPNSNIVQQLQAIPRQSLIHKLSQSNDRVLSKIELLFNNTWHQLDSVLQSIINESPSLDSDIINMLKSYLTSIDWVLYPCQTHNTPTSGYVSFCDCQGIPVIAFTWSYMMKQVYLQNNFSDLFDKMDMLSSASQTSEPSVSTTESNVDTPAPMSTSTPTSTSDADVSMASETNPESQVSNYNPILPSTWIIITILVILTLFTIGIYIYTS